jgi:hypothetical protein
VGKMVVRVLVAEGTTEKGKEERDDRKKKSWGGRLIFCQLRTRFSSSSGH